MIRLTLGVAGWALGHRARRVDAVQTAAVTLYLTMGAALVTLLAISWRQAP